MAEERDLASAEYWSRYWGGSTRVRKARALRRAGWRERLLCSLLDRAGTDPVDILELGCAPGEMLELLFALRPQHRYHGLDYSEEGLAFTRQRLEGAGVKADLHCGDLHEFECEQRFDLVVSFGLVEHFTDPAAVLAHHARFLRPGGIVAVTLPNYSARPVKWVIERLDPEALKTHSLDIMNAAALAKAMRDAGLAEVETGATGPSKFRTSCKRKTLARRLLRDGIKLWNGVSRLLPSGWPWPTAIWGSGRAGD